MSEFKDLLDQERRRHRMSDGSFRDLERRRDRKRRNRRLASGALALVIAAAGIGAGVYAFRPTGSATPGHPSPSVSPTGPGPSPSGTVEPAPSASAMAAPSSLLQFIDDQHGWAVINGQLMSSTDGGVTWTPAKVGSRVEAVDFVDLQHGWAVSSGGLFVTDDGGASWSLANDQAFKTVDFVDSMNGWAVGSDSYPTPGLLVKTTDGGHTWESQGLTTDSVCVTTTGRAWAAGLSGDGGVISVFRWDGGSAIETRLPLPQGEPWTATIRCSLDGSAAFVLVTGGGAAGHVAYAAFQVTPGGSNDDVHPVLVASFAAGELGLDAYQDDDPYPGVFTVLGSGAADFVNWCPACDGSWASFLTAEGQPASVTDRIAIPTSQNPRAPIGISFVDRNRGWVLFDSPELLLMTKDGGKTWTGPCDPPTSCFPSVSVP